jgi:hypothetical protein
MKVKGRNTRRRPWNGRVIDITIAQGGTATVLPKLAKAAHKTMLYWDVYNNDSVAHTVKVDNFRPDPQHNHAPNPPKPHPLTSTPFGKSVAANTRRTIDKGTHGHHHSGPYSELYEYDVVVDGNTARDPQVLIAGDDPLPVVPPRGRVASEADAQRRARRRRKKKKK